MAFRISTTVLPKRLKAKFTRRFAVIVQLSKKVMKLRLCGLEGRQFSNVLGKLKSADLCEIPEFCGLKSLESIAAQGFSIST